MLSKKKTDAIALLVQGKRQGEVARILDVEESTISRWLHNNAEFMETYKAEMNKIMLLGSSLAYQRMEELLDSDNEAVVFKAAKDILDRGGFGAVNRYEELGDKVIMVSIVDESGQEILINGEIPKEEEEED